VSGDEGRVAADATDEVSDRLRRAPRPSDRPAWNPKTGIKPFARLVAQVMTTEPYAGAGRVFWIVDSGSSHRGRASVKRMTKAWPTAQLVHLPVHASWLDQAEIFFSILQRKVLTPNDLTNLDALAERVLAFQARYNATATPFDWRFTRADLNRLLDRIAVHEAAVPIQSMRLAAA